MSLDNKEVEKIAQLARLHISAQDSVEVSRRISDILTLIDQMQDVDTSNVKPLAHSFDAIQPLRADEVTEVDQRETLQRIAPATENGLYLVPRVIE